MSEHNHRRATRRQRYPAMEVKTETILSPRSTLHGETYEYLDTEVPLHNGYRPRNGKPWGYIDKSLHGWGRKSALADRIVGASIGNDFSNGDRGMAKAVRGAKKFVRSRFRFHENAETRRLARNAEIEAES